MKSGFYVASTYVRLLLQANPAAGDLVRREIGPQLDRLLEAEFVPGHLITQVFHRFAEQGVQSWATYFGKELSIASHGPMGFAILSAPDLHTALSVLVEYQPIRASGYILSMRSTRNRVELVVEDKTGDELTGRWRVESCKIVAQSLIETITAHPLGDNASIQLAYPPPPNRQAFENLFSAPCTFEAEENVLSIPASWTSISSPLYDEATFRSNLAKCREIKLELGIDPYDIAQRVNARLISHLERRVTGLARSDRIPGLDALADELCMSSRTLIRKLEKQGTSYKQLLEQVRRDQALHLLKDTHLTAAEIAEKLGYQEPANFGRAFKRWYGSSPAQWRRQI